jgi:hypothetical protein
MQTLPPTDRKHLSHDAALMLLAVLPEHIRTAYLNHARQIDYSIELVLEMALADFLDPDSLTFADCKPQIGLPHGETQNAMPGDLSAQVGDRS